MEYQEVIEKRFTVRKFDKKAEVPEEQIKAILEAGRIAPTAGNVQSQRIYVVNDAANLKKLDTATQCRYGATCALIVGFSNEECMKRKEFSPYDKWNFGEQDSVIVMTHMILKATDLGLGSCWVGAFNTLALKRALELPNDFQARAILMLGTPAEDAEPAENHADRKPLEETVTWIQPPAEPEPAAAAAPAAAAGGDDRAAARAARRAARAAAKAAE